MKDKIRDTKEKLHRQIVNSWCMYDWANSAFATTIMAAVLPPFYNTVAGANLGGNRATVYWGYTRVRKSGSWAFSSAWASWPPRFSTRSALATG